MWTGAAPRRLRTPAPSQNLPSAVAASQAPAPAPAPAPERTIPVISGTCFLTMAVKVPNPYGWVTYQRDTAFQYLGPVGDRLIVKRGFEEFTVTPDMVTGGIAASQPASTPGPGLIAANPPARPADSPTPRRILPVVVPGNPFGKPGATASPTASPSATPEEPSHFTEYARYLLLADGAEGKGSGCLVNYQGKTRVITNAHVLSGNANLRFRRLNGDDVATGPFSFANGADLAVADQTGATGGLEVADVDKEVNIGDEVVVMGNSLGSDVVTEIKGEVKGIGPDLVEVDAKFVEGNSGSPIIDLKTGKLIGVATYVEKRSLDSLAKDSQFATEFRRFGYRLDTVKTWQHPTPQQFAAEAKIVKAVQKQTEDLFRLGQDIYAGHIVLEKHTDPDNRLSGIVTDFMAANKSKDKDGAAASEARAQFQQALIFETQEDITGLRPQDFTWFHWHELQEEINNRGYLKKAFERLLRTDEAADQVLH